MPGFQLVEFVALVVVGFTACAEIGSFLFVHPVIRTLPPRYQVGFEKGLLKTFGRAMPLLMTMTPILLGSQAAQLDGAARTLGLMAMVATVLALISTIAVNVGINQATGHWDPGNPPPNWVAIRRRWDRWQGIRASLLMVGFVLLAAASAA